MLLACLSMQLLFHYSLTPVAEVRGDDKEIGRVCQILSEQLAVHFLAICGQRTDQHRHNGELTLPTATNRRDNVTQVTIIYC